MTHPLRSLAARLRAFRRNTRGNVLMLFGLAITPLAFSVGMGIDYARAMRTQTKMNAAADAAALAAVSKMAMKADEPTAKWAALVIFMTQTQDMIGGGGLVINYLDPSQLNIDVHKVSGSGASGEQRVATVTYSAQSTNTFARILGLDTLHIHGSASTAVAQAPNIDFHMLLDTSGSMALPTTTAGIAKLKQATGGCAFACHSTNAEKAKDKNGVSTDYYGVARSWNLPLRIDEIGRAVQNLVSVANTTSSSNRARYRMSVSRFAEGGMFGPGRSFETLQTVTSDLASAGSKAAAVQIASYWANNTPEQGRGNSDRDTASSDAFTKMNSMMLDPGNGSNANGDPPQAIMFVITDGMRDESRPGGKPEVEFERAKCTAIKNRNIRIAILYTEYLPESINNNSWATDPGQGNVYNRLPLIEPALQDCASPGLYYKVTTDDDISAALGSLFQKAVSTARLTQ